MASKPSPKKKPVSTEAYRGYTIELPTFDWDDQYRVKEDGKELGKFDTRAEARDWIDKFINTQA